MTYANLPLSEGEFTIGHDKVFMPFDAERDVLTDRAKGSLLVEVQPFLLVTERDVILLDTGLGFSGPDGRPQIFSALAAQGYKPTDVTKVLLSHLHKDHAGGVVLEESSGRPSPSFPHADYYIYRPEAEAALEAGFPSYHVSEIVPLLESGIVKWLDAPAGTIDGYIRYQLTGGHSIAHIVFWIEEGGQTIFFGGDEAPQLKQMKVRYQARYDFDGKKAMEWRALWAEEAKEKGWTMLFYHDIAQPVVLFGKNG